MARRYVMRTRWLGVVMVLGALAPAAGAAEDRSLNRAVAEIARSVADFLTQHDTREIQVGLFNDDENPNHTAGPGLRKRLIEALRRSGVNPVPGAGLILKGDFKLREGRQVLEGQEQTLPVAKISFKIVRRGDDKPLVDSEKDVPADDQPVVSKPEDVAVLFGPTVSQPPDLPPGEKAREFFKSEEGKGDTFTIEGGRVRPKGAPYAVEMLVAPLPAGQKPNRNAFRPRPLEVRDGQPFLKVRPGEAVAVRVINDAGHDAASTVTIDGLSLFAFRDDKAARGEHVVIRAHSSGDVLGWFRNERTSDAFLAAELPKDAPDAKLLKNPGDIGAITVTFAAAWEKDDQMPPDEPSGRQAVELKPGPPIDAPYEKVKRHIGVLRAAVTVRYDKM